jgi:hypothetical protein
MIRHDHNRMKVNRSSVVMDAMLQHYPAGDRGKYQIFIRTEGYEEWPVIALVVG